MQVLKILIIGLLLFFPFGELIRVDLGNNIIFKPIDAISVLILLWNIVLYIRDKKHENLHWYFFIFPIVGFISLLLNSFWLRPNELLASSLYLIRWIAYLGVFFSLLRLDKKFHKKIFWLLLADGLVILIIGYIQFFLYPSLKNLLYEGWDEHLYRMFSSFLDPNFVGAFFVLYFIFVAALLFTSFNKNRKLTVFYSLLLFITLIGVFLTYSRSALLMLIAGAVTFFFSVRQRKFILYLLLTIILFIILASPFFYIDNLDLFRLHSSLSRLGDIESGLIIFRDHPILGVGFNTYRYAQINYHFLNPSPPFQSHAGSGTDNSFVFILATTGILGFAAYLYLWYKLFIKVKITKGKYSIVFISSAIGLIVNSFFNNSLFYPEIMLWMWFITSFIFEKN